MKRIFLIVVLFTSICFAQSDYSSKLDDNLLSLQKISVTVGGDFFVNGSFPALSTERVDDFLTRLFNESRQVALTAVKDRISLSEVKREFENFALRDIKIKRIDGTELIVDLAKFRLNGDFSNNPYLRNNDVIIIPKLDLELNFVEVDGAINKPGKIQYTIGDKLSDIIFLSLGINEAYEDVNNAQISRLSYDGTKEENFVVEISQDFELKRGDRIKILAEETRKRDFKVLVVGEVLNPGYVPITKDNTTIKEVISKVGGFRPNADLNRAELIKGTDNSQSLTVKAIKEAYKNEEDIHSLILSESLSELYIEKLKMARMADISVEDTTSFVIDNTLRVLNGVGLINFNRINSDSTEDGEFILHDGDIGVIPEKQELVHVYGQVKKPGYTYFSEGKDYEYYINMAGGLGDVADNTWIIRGDSHEWIEADEELEINAGDFVYVQKEVKPSSSQQTMSYTLIASAISTLASLALVVINIINLSK